MKRTKVTAGVRGSIWADEFLIRAFHDFRARKEESECAIRIYETVTTGNSKGQRVWDRDTVALRYDGTQDYIVQEDQILNILHSNGDHFDLLLTSNTRSYKKHPMYYKTESSKRDINWSLIHDSPVKKPRNKPIKLGPTTIPIHDVLKSADAHLESQEPMNFETDFIPLTSYPFASSNESNFDVVQEQRRKDILFAQAALLVWLRLNGTKLNPVGHLRIGPMANLPISRHRLQRVFSRGIQDTLRDIYEHNFRHSRLEKYGTKSGCRFYDAIQQLNFSATVGTDETEEIIKERLLWMSGILSPMSKELSPIFTGYNPLPIEIIKHMKANSLWYAGELLLGFPWAGQRLSDPALIDGLNLRVVGNFAHRAFNKDQQHLPEDQRMTCFLTTSKNKKCGRPLMNGRHLTDCPSNSGSSHHRHDAVQKVIIMALNESSTSTHPRRIYDAEKEALQIYPDQSRYANIPDSNKNNFAQRPDITVLNYNLPRGRLLEDINTNVNSTNDPLERINKTLDHCLTHGVMPIQYDVFTITKPGEKALIAGDVAKTNKYNRTHHRLEQTANIRLPNSTVAYPRVKSLCEKINRVYNGKPKVIPLGMNIDGSISPNLMHLFEDCAKRLHPKTLNSKSYIIRRSQFIQKYIRLCQAHMIRTYSSKLDQAERYFKESQNQWDVLTQQEELRQIDRNGLMVLNF